jgi:hypothetical protein
MLGLANVIPLQGRGSVEDDAADLAQQVYEIRSGYGWFSTYAFQWNLDMTKAPRSAVVAESQILFGADPSRQATLAEIFEGDYYPLIDYYDQDLATTGWAGWQFQRSDLRAGLVQIFARRATNSPTDWTAHLKNLQPATQYTLVDLDSPTSSTTRNGQSLMTNGIAVTCADAQCPTRLAKVFRYSW